MELCLKNQRAVNVGLSFDRMNHLGYELNRRGSALMKPLCRNLSKFVHPTLSVSYIRDVTSVCPSYMVSTVWELKLPTRGNENKTVVNLLSRDLIL